MRNKTLIRLTQANDTTKKVDLDVDRIYGLLDGVMIGAATRIITQGALLDVVETRQQIYDTINREAGSIDGHAITILLPDQASDEDYDFSLEDTIPEVDTRSCVLALLSQHNIYFTFQEVDVWSVKQKLQAYQWAMACQAHSADHEVPEEEMVRPDFIREHSGKELDLDDIGAKLDASGQIDQVLGG